MSPTTADVNSGAPANLQLQAGHWEARFRENAEQLLDTAGGRQPDLANGRGRALVLIPRADHIGILFSHASHRAAVDWLDQTFGRQPDAGDYRDWRVLWYFVHILGWLLAIGAVVPALARSPRPAANRVRHRLHWLGLALAPLVATAGLYLLEQRTETIALGGMLIGGALGLWFLLLGLLWLAFGFRPRRPDRGDIIWGLILFLFLWLAVAALAEFVWLPALLIGPRLLRWPLLAAAFLPWSLAAGLAQEGAGPLGRAAWWLVQNALILGGLIVAVSLIPSLFVLVLVLPILPAVLAIATTVNAAVDRPWSYALANALFFGWLIAAYVPLID